MSWLIDNATSLSILLGVLAAALVLIWRSSGKNKYLGYAAGAVAVLGAIWLLSLFVETDSKQLKSNVHAMATAVEAGKMDDLFKHVSKDFAYHGMTRDMLYEAARHSIGVHKVKEVLITNFRIDDVSRAKKSAKTRFHVSGTANEQTYMFVTQADFVLEGEQWKLKSMRFYPAIGNQDQEIRLPGIQ